MKKFLKENTVYIADNGQMICSQCAGSSALYSGHDISGQKVLEMKRPDADWFKQETGSFLRCEAGCTWFDESQIVEYLSTNPESLEDVEFDGINMNDRPDFCDAYITSASYDGVNLKDEVIEKIADSGSEIFARFVNEQVHESFAY